MIGFYRQKKESEGQRVYTKFVLIQINTGYKALKEPNFLYLKRKIEKS